MVRGAKNDDEENHLTDLSISHLIEREDASLDFDMFGKVKIDNNATVTKTITKSVQKNKDLFENVDADYLDELTALTSVEKPTTTKSVSSGYTTASTAPVKDIDMSSLDLDAYINSQEESSGGGFTNKPNAHIYFPRHKHSKQRHSLRRLEEILIDNSLVIQHEHNEFYEITISTASDRENNDDKQQTNQRTANTNINSIKQSLRTSSVEIQCNTEAGLLLALSTLSQLLASPVLPVRLPFTLLDWPDNNWRGILIDVSRHFQPLPLLKRTLDAMEASKLNVLHLHLTDAQSFPLLLNDVVYNGTEYGE
eukprot:gene35863-44223_t